jgi:shikimate dehydrogenase
MNVTIPHKVEVMRHLDWTDPLAKRIGAVNTIHNFDGKLKGYNTDGFGALSAITEAGVRVRGKKVLVIGAGGASRAIVFTLATQGGAKEITILNRTAQTASRLANAVSTTTNCTITGGGLGGMRAAFLDCDFLVNCTSVGLKSNESVVDKKLLEEHQPAVFDAVFNPLMTRLLLDAKDAGCKIVTGDGMLLHQGAKSFEIWTGKKPDVEAMRKALRNALDG